MNRAKALKLIAASPIVVGCAGGGLDQTVPAPLASSQSNDGVGASSAARASPGRSAQLVELVSNLPRASCLTFYGPNVVIGIRGQVIVIPRTGGMPSVLLSDETLKNTDARLDVVRLVVANSTLVIGAAGRSGYYRIVRLSFDTGEHAIIGHIERGTFLDTVGDTVYCAQNYSLLCSLPISGGPRRTVRWNLDVRAAIADTEALYLVDRRSRNVVRYTTATQSLNVLLSDIAQDATLVQDETNVYVGSAAAIRRLPKNGNPPVTVIYTGQSPRVIAVGGDTVFLVDGATKADGAIKAVSNAGGVPRTLASNIDVGSAIADGRFLYFTGSKGDGPAALYRIEYAT